MYSDYKKIGVVMQPEYLPWSDAGYLELVD
jgi:hypothetical protein